MNINHLSLSWSTSRGADTYGYNICRLDDHNEGKRYRCIGGGYDMTGTVFGEWLQENYQAELVALFDKYPSVDCGYTVTGYRKIENLYGLNLTPGGAAVPAKATLDGACGLSSMISIAEAIGLEVQRDGDRKGRTIGFFIVPKEQA